MAVARRFGVRAVAVICLHDTLTGRIRRLRLRRPGEVSMYVCGPTVYDHPHLGHARSALTYDVLRRYLQWLGLGVLHVANITDIDDKIIERARREGRTEPEVAEKWEAVYAESMAALGVLVPHERPHATEWVNEMVDFVERIHTMGLAYATDSGMYLRVHRVPGYGDLVHRDLDDLRASAGGRVQVDEAKEDPLDFALWKAAKPGEPSWDSPWGPGRPGWHIECVAMSLGILGDGFDLHGGGNDLIFPHHTNERAEALAAGSAFAQHWMHNAMLNVDGDKMAKSLGNFRTIADLLHENPRNARALRLLVLQTHYRKTMEVNAEFMAAARAAAARLDAMVRRAAVAGIPVDVDADTGVRAARSVPGVRAAGEREGNSDDGNSGPAAESVNAFRAAMDDDMGTPEALAVVFETLRRANASLDADNADAAALVWTVVDLAGVLGLRPEISQSITGGVSVGGVSGGVSVGSGVSVGGSSSDHDDDGLDHDDDRLIELLMSRRQAARQAKDWSAADALRDQLAALGVTVEDTPGGSTWRLR